MIPFTVIGGQVGDWRYLKSSTTIVAGGKPRISAFGRIEFSETRFGVYEVILSGRLDATNLNSLVGIWLYDATQPKGNELDWEILYRGDPHQRDRVLLSCYLPTLKQVSRHVGCHEKHRITLSYEATVSRVKYEALNPVDGKWNDIAFLQVVKSNLPGCTLRIAASVKGGVLAPGEHVTRFVVEDVTFKPL